MPGRTVILLLLIGLVIAPAAADVIPPGQKTVSSCFEIGNTGEYPDYLFIAFPLSMSGGYAVMKPGDCVSFYKFASPSLYAVKRDAFNETAAGEGGQISSNYFSSDPGVIPSGIAIRGSATVAENSPVKSISTIYTITSVNPTRLGIIPARERYTYTDGRTEEKPLLPEETTVAPAGMDPLAPVLTIMAGSAIALIVGMRVRKR